jgi:ABC-type polysaccharide/polyol phosphate export permease
MIKFYLFQGIRDFKESFKFQQLVKTLIGLDIKRRYRRSYLGPFWTTTSLTINILIVTTIFTSIGEGSIWANLPYTAIGVLLWHFISTNALESCDTFIQAATIIRQANAPIYVYIYRVIFRNLVFFFHNLLIIIIVFLVAPWHIGLEAFYALAGFLFLLINIFSLSILLSIFTARFRDIGQLVTNLLPIIFYITPIIWKRGFTEIVSKIDNIIIFNPIYSSISVIREPLLGQPVDINCWYVVITITPVLFLTSIYCYGKLSKRVAFWI